MTAWKDLERKAAKVLGGERIKRGADFSESAPDVKLPMHPRLAIDCKYQKGGFAHHSLLKVVEQKYCTNGPQLSGSHGLHGYIDRNIPVLITKSGRKHGEVVSLKLEDFAELLRVAAGTEEDS